MKRFTLFAMLALGASVHAQLYGWEVDGTGANEFLQRGEVSMVDFAFPMGQRGHIFSGNNDNGFSELEITATSPDAGIIYFQNEYGIWDPGGAVQFPSRKVLVCEGPNVAVGANNYAYCAVGDLEIMPGQYALYYAPLDNLGNPTILTPNNGWMYFNNPFWTMSARDARYVPATGLLYILAAAQTTTGFNYMIIIAVDPFTGVVAWDGIYGHFPNNLANEPQKLTYLPNTGELVAVGHYDNGADWDSYLFHVNAAAGGVGVWSEYGGPGSNDRLWGVTPVNQFTALGAGLMAVGTSDRPGHEDTWAMRVNIGYNLLWSHLFDNPWFPFTDEWGQAIVQRRNAMGQFDYFISGSYAAGANGGADIHMMKLNEFGFALANGSYGGPTNDYGLWIDHDPAAGPNPGVNAYGITDLGVFGGMDFTTFRAYYNLEAFCQDILMVPPANPALMQLPTQSWMHEKGHDTKDIMFRQITTTNTAIMCQGLDPMGNNMKTAQPGIQLTASSSPDGISVELVAPSAATCEITLTNLAGQVLVSKTASVQEGNQTLTLDAASLPAGIYLLTVNNGATQATEKVLVQ